MGAEVGGIDGSLYKKGRVGAGAVARGEATRTGSETMLLAS
jgi:hypothetical protein